jgi:hypothetical protein
MMRISALEENLWNDVATSMKFMIHSLAVFNRFMVTIITGELLFDVLF